MQSFRCIFILFSATVGDGSAPPSNINEKVADYCSSRVGQAVGNGQCTGLASEALRFAGGKVPRHDETDPGPGDYVWGKRVFLLDAAAKPARIEGELRDLRPGDIIQFRDAIFVSRTPSRISYKTAIHHTAIIAKIGPGRGTVQVWEQNINGKTRTVKTRYDFGAIQKGWVRVYRPIPISTDE